jgi:phosphoribosyl 1,2-cyclic phosphodiesterase
LGSGSKGNATVVESDDTCVLVDCGFSTREVEKRLQRLQKTPQELTAILVTHEHSDHVQGVARLSRKYKLPVWMTAGTYSRCRQRDEYPFISVFSSHQVFSIDALEIHPFPVPHDAREPVQFVFSDGSQRLGVLTDTGCITAHIRQMLDGVDALLLEGNHDLDMLMNGSYPQQLKQRVAGRTGHLSNEQAAGLLRSIDCDHLQHIVAAHLSEKNNHPDKVLESFSSALNCSEDWVELADQETGFDWKVI